MGPQYRWACLDILTPPLQTQGGSGGAGTLTLSK
jgi:hypothetical protein